MTKSRGLIVRVPWTQSEDSTLRRRYPHEKASAIALDLGRPVHVIHSRAHRLGVAKSEEFMTSAASGRIIAGATSPASIQTRFQKGGKPWNTGTKGLAGNHENSRRTQFKKGDTAGKAARNYVPIGTEKISKDGYLIRKITDDPSLVPARRWEAVHRLVWVAGNGPIPSGYAVVFKNGRRTVNAPEITVDSLELVTRRELMRRNSYHTNYPKEVAQLIQLKGALTRKINSRGAQ